MGNLPRAAFALLSFFVFVLRYVITAGATPSGPWDAYNFAPKSRTAYPVAVTQVTGSVSNASALTRQQGEATLQGNGSWVALDFGKEIAGLVTMRLGQAASESESEMISLAFTESPLFIGPT